MALTYLYADAYLAPLVTDAREDAAINDVTMLGTFPADWTEKLVVLRAYVLTCIESQRAPDDLFSSKLSAYRKEWDAALPLARAAQMAAEAAANPGGGASYSPFTIALERG